MTSRDNNVLNYGLINLIYQHLKDTGLEKVANVLKKHVPKVETEGASTSLNDIYTTWTNGKSEQQMTGQEACQVKSSAPQPDTDSGSSSESSDEDEPPPFPTPQTCTDGVPGVSGQANSKSPAADSKPQADSSDTESSGDSDSEELLSHPQVSSIAQTVAPRTPVKVKTALPVRPVEPKSVKSSKKTDITPKPPDPVRCSESPETSDSDDDTSSSPESSPPVKGKKTKPSTTSTPVKGQKTTPAKQANEDSLNSSFNAKPKVSKPKGGILKSSKTKGMATPPKVWPSPLTQPAVLPAEKKKKKSEKKPEKAKQKKRSGKPQSGPPCPTPAAGGESDSDSSLDVEKWKALALQITDSDIAKVEELIDPGLLAPHETVKKKQQTKSKNKEEREKTKTLSKRSKASVSKELSDPGKTNTVNKSKANQVKTDTQTMSPSQRGSVSVSAPENQTPSQTVKLKDDYPSSETKNTKTTPMKGKNSILKSVSEPDKLKKDQTDNGLSELGQIKTLSNKVDVSVSSVSTIQTKASSKSSKSLSFTIETPSAEEPSSFVLKNLNTTTEEDSISATPKRQVKKSKKKKVLDEDLSNSDTFKTQSEENPNMEYSLPQSEKLVTPSKKDKAKKSESDDGIPDSMQAKTSSKKRKGLSSTTHPSEEDATPASLNPSAKFELSFISDTPKQHEKGSSKKRKVLHEHNSLPAAEQTKMVANTDGTNISPGLSDTDANKKMCKNGKAKADCILEQSEEILTPSKKDKRKKAEVDGDVSNTIQTKTSSKKSKSSTVETLSTEDLPSSVLQNIHIISEESSISLTPKQHKKKSSKRKKVPDDDSLSKPEDISPEPKKAKKEKTHKEIRIEENEKVFDPVSPPALEPSPGEDTATPTNPKKKKKKKSKDKMEDEVPDASDVPDVQASTPDGQTLKKKKKSSKKKQVDE